MLLLCSQSCVLNSNTVPILRIITLYYIVILIIIKKKTYVEPQKPVTLIARKTRLAIGRQRTSSELLVVDNTIRNIINCVVSGQNAPATGIRNIRYFFSVQIITEEIVFVSYTQ